ncbi:MAG: rhomboid family intramembrane serine protease [Bacteroidetes bacterium CG23_combo_of_CG06-09_8_20_14_all_32_9]|nr:MAG: rhomboid family intramembrane serine protease [Bacteroidetes bacterium CG23_combo_of_CG06-09_8_20_14_all_32_9]
MNFEKKKFLLSIFFPALFVGMLWLIKVSELVLNEDFSSFGLYPLKIKGIIGIFTSPLIHGNIDHLLANTIPLLVLGTSLFYFYSKVSYKVFILIYIITGIWVWFSGRPAYHIGASGIVYGLAGFVFTSGIILRNFRLLSISLLVVFLYGSMVWGIFPIDPKISWESHFMGLIAGIVLAIYYRNESSFPANDSYEENDDDNNENIDWQIKNKENKISYLNN